MATIYKMLAMREGEAGFVFQHNKYAWENIVGGNGVRVGTGEGWNWTTAETSVPSLTSFVIGLTSKTSFRINLGDKRVTFADGIVSIWVGESFTVAGSVLSNPETPRRFEIEYTPTKLAVYANGVLQCEYAVTNSVCNSIVFGGFERAPRSDIASYIADLTVSDVRLGDVHVAYLLPNGNGVTSEWVGSDGDSVDNYALIDEHPWQGADYVKPTGTGQRDMYQMADLSAASGQVLAVQVAPSMVKSDAGTPPDTSYVIRESGGTETTEVINGIGIGLLQQDTPILHTKPSGGAWTPAVVNDMQVGVET